jgi:hypothetical protein
MNRTQNPYKSKPGKKDMTMPTTPMIKEIQNVICFGGVIFIFLSFIIMDDRAKGNRSPEKIIA